MDNITADEVEAAINSSTNHKAPGPSGIAPLHLKFLVDEFPDFI
jgi:hypothetical protein